MKQIIRVVLVASSLALLALGACFCGTPAQQSGVGRECASNDDCADDQSCLAFKGGYCGLEDCDLDADCPGGSACVAHDDGQNYCFLLCVDKPECNANRTAENEANCSSSVTFVEEQQENVKACVPPSST